MSEVKVNKISPRSGTTVTLGDSGDTFTIPSGATIPNAGTAAGFGSTGEISWDTTPKTGDFTGVSGVGYFVNTAGGEVTITLPGSPSAGNVIGVSDYNSTAATNSIVINRNSNKINGGTDNTGGGGGGQHGPCAPSNVGPAGAGGSGIVVIRYKFQ